MMTTAAGTAVSGGVALAERLSFREDVRLERDGAALRLTSYWGAQLIRRPSEPLAAALYRLTRAPVTADELADELLGTGRTGFEGAGSGGTGAGGAGAGGAAGTELARLHWTLDRLQPLLVRRLVAGDRPLLTVVPIGPRARVDAVPAVLAGPARLSRFAYLHRRGDGLVAESPLSQFRIELCSDAAVLAAAELAGLNGRTPADPAHRATAVSWLVWTGMAEAADDDQGRPRFAEDDSPVLRQWEFHDLLFHARSRLGRHADDFGATFPFLGELDPEPALRPLPAGRPVPLTRPDLGRLARQDPPLAAVMESRRSVRAYAEEPPTTDQIGELLYRTARVRAIKPPDPAGGMPYEASDRPYPSGGAAYELELYLTVNRCAGLEQGSYYYDPAGHRLIRLTQEQDATQALLHRAYVACAGLTVPDVLITITARFQRLGWKYRGLAYAATLKHVGVLYHSLYLAATAMGLAPCGLGSGDADLAAKAFGLDWARESSVGEFMIGSRPVPAAGPDAPTAGLDVHDQRIHSLRPNAPRSLRTPANPQIWSENDLPTESR